jgi:hypothetical protein
VKHQCPLFRMRMPGRGRAGLEAHQTGAYARWRRRFDDRSCHTVPVKVSAGPRRVGRDPYA